MPLMTKSSSKFAIVWFVYRREKIRRRQADTAHSHAMSHGADSKMKSPEQHILGQVGKGFSHDLEQQHKGRFKLVDKKGSDCGIRFGKGTPC